ncbi:pyruvate kinase [Boletus reticuloceps]|uniref:Pyruvate kinase n=1 Tax=Boletus reticuloceps TaxID=495285 RepID=A0A8I2Z0H0_9AGAM|nr:pyruvate kinase [Boletus reticuloceps]
MDPPSATGEGGDNTGGRVWASFDSAPVTIISKPSKKTAKTRNISSCILAGGPVSLFNRINSQTVRTKYMTIDSAQLCASNVSWSAFNVNVVHRPEDATPVHGMFSRDLKVLCANTHVHNTTGGHQAVTYGCEVVLSDTLSNIATSPLIIRKVDKGRVSAEDGGPVSQMQKIALQRVNADGSRHYLSAAGPLPGPPGVTASTSGVSSQGGTHPLIFQSPRVREEMKDGVRVLSDEVDDYLCWTIVGISKFQYTFFDAFGQNNSIPELPITPFPTLFTPPNYHPANNTLELTVSNFFYEDPKTRAQQPLTVYLGNVHSRISTYGGGIPGPSSELTPNDGAVPGVSSNVTAGRYTPLHTLVTVELPSLNEIIKALQEDVIPPNALTTDGATTGPHTAPPGGECAALGTQVDGSTGGGPQTANNSPQPSITSSSLPILFIRSSDGVGYHSGRTITCENVFQSMDLSGMAPGHVLTPPGGPTADPGWLAAAQAAASANGGLHGWTLRGESGSDKNAKGRRDPFLPHASASRLTYSTRPSAPAKAIHPTAETKYLRKTAIIATIGPNTNSVEKLAALRRAGVNVVRMNFSHGSYDYHQSVIDNTRKMVAAEPGRPVAIALDTKGPEIRTGLMKDGKDIPIKAGHEFIITTDDKYSESCDSERLWLDYKNLPKVTAPGKLIYVDDGDPSDSTLEAYTHLHSGILSLLVLSIDGGNTDVDLPALSEKDKKDLQFGVKNGVDMVFASFIRRAQDVKDIRHVLGPDGASIKIIVKIENEQGVENFDEILRECDGVMVARGDLGIEIPASQVFLAQKMMIAKCNIAGKPVIVATQMLESMTYNPRPTRAEVSDVANAVLDGADCVMLSGETAKGSYPVESVLMMAETCLLAEAAICYPPLYDELKAIQPRPTETVETVAIAAVAAASEQSASAILVLSTSGNTARLVSKYRPLVPIITVTRNEQTARQIHLHRGCYPFWYPEPRGIPESQWQKDVDNRIRFGLKNALELNIIKTGTTIIAVQGWKGGLGHTNTLRILSVPTDAADLELQPLGAN